MTPTEASIKKNESIVYKNLYESDTMKISRGLNPTDKVLKPKFNIGDKQSPKYYVIKFDHIISKPSHNRMIFM
jgi:hypothetical protein